ncbi:two-component system phosphate regulon sensor histidine kinase PhoR [Parabacteroides sp. PF5-5]|uniref:sensor histidine kinase n=1 Tax=unclassified Parabacteroides TaxID=2649774 RepID=UPI002474565B|nr:MULTISPECIES: HAMP domain-containing sensor histidine kinase [unclassified Parabacteroides]MDH6306378.1 two-component system phosphate regulon sensor histidine kinase PhoR [Parabacteroides sp. PH5-39]MDH6314650.1 two-component system phosphate regulon sensor histidine kinase PhoR [Parabacteroides sp. PF5-13]MDH6321089.1 two-component system phosphate regulon sensor histidine kinase PhoR [Parabacteroides sp. PH5-13]MDH6324821.1 two-component system phosphate regulon sensor histidine kinase Ph
MERRIRIIWILSLASALLLIGVQGYWLYNQYQYVTDTYSQELAEKILQAGEKEYTIRKNNIKLFYTYIIQQNSEYSNTGEEGMAKQHLAFSFTHDRNESKPMAQKSIDLAQKALKMIDNDSLRHTALPKDSVRLNLSFPMQISTDSMHAGINRAVTNFNNPFDEALLDSILTSDLPDIRYTIKQDTVPYTSQWEKSGSLLHPAIAVSYVYSPFEKKGILIEVGIPSQPVFKRMTIQLLLALGLILLLIACLVLQIKTILKQKKLSELRESFVNTMIHELRRPVQTLKTFVSFLGDKEMRADETATEQVLQDSMFELDNLSAYLNKLKDMVRADNESTPLRLLKFNLEELTEKVIRLTHTPSGKNVKISARYEMESPWIEADPVHIANILSNLIENAVKYSGAEVDIEINARQKGRELWLTVSDNGIGIPYAEQEKVFAKFYRGTNLPGNDVPGIGLGLSYVKLITEAHHGNVSLSSHLGKGTSVTLYLPQ